tara:strand:+ start:257 stop:523 length:267 start_codon:yes stop_codon:yes gene_type:complete
MISRDLCTYGQDTNKIISSNSLHLIESYNPIIQIKKVLEDKGIEIVIGKNGKEGLTCLNDNPDVHLVLMDIMMTEMDGYTTIGEAGQV